MIRVIHPSSSVPAGAIAISALQRSCGNSQVEAVSIADLVQWLEKPRAACWMLINPLETWSELIIKVLKSIPNKILLFGEIPPSLADHLEVTIAPVSIDLQEAALCDPAPTYGYTESAAKIHYRQFVAGVKSPISIRPFLRYDFMDEWNNLGYGAIKTDDSIWAICQQMQLASHVTVADVKMNNESVSAYAGLWDFPKSSLLWFNRSVGPVDSQEWRIVESFITNYRHGELPCQPILSEIPYGYDAAVTMRLDCDEDIESARNLWHAYQQRDIPLSLALLTTILDDPRHYMLPRDVLTDGGAVLSHTATHAPDWGGSYDAAYTEATHSAATISRVTGHEVRYAVSPFHQTPEYARIALADAGYSGCIGGIICNDPDFLMARAGTPPGSAEDFIGHSQQCMLHGDCMLQESDPLRIFKQAFDQARAGRTFFGYLDHPFSERYQYGWSSESHRIAIHQDFITYMQQSGNVLFCNEDDAMDFFRQKASVNFKSEDEGYRINIEPEYYPKWPISIEYAGNVYSLSEDGLKL